MPDKEFTSETIRLRANEAMLNSKGFLLFICGGDGSLELIGDMTELTQAEQYGLDGYRKNTSVKG